MARYLACPPSYFLNTYFNLFICFSAASVIFPRLVLTIQKCLTCFWSVRTSSSGRMMIYYMGFHLCLNTWSEHQPKLFLRKRDNLVIWGEVGSTAYKTTLAVEAQNSDESLARTWFERGKTKPAFILHRWIMSSYFGFSFPLPFWHGLPVFVFAKQTVALHNIFNLNKASSGGWCWSVASTRRDGSWSIPGLALARELRSVATDSSLHSMLAWGRRLRFIDSCCVPPRALF